MQNQRYAERPGKPRIPSLDRDTQSGHCELLTRIGMYFGGAINRAHDWDLHPESELSSASPELRGHHTYRVCMTSAEETLL